MNVKHKYNYLFYFNIASFLEGTFFVKKVPSNSLQKTLNITVHANKRLLYKLEVFERGLEKTFCKKFSPSSSS